MVYTFDLPTTSHLSFQSFLSSRTHPSLPQAASTARHALRLALKTHNRLPRGPQRDSHLVTVLTTLNDYTPYLLAISHGLSGKPIETTSSSAPSEVIEVTLHRDFEPEWRATLSSNSSLSLKPTTTGRARGPGIQFETAFTLTTLGYVLCGLARSGVIRTLYANSTPTLEQRTTAIQTATKHLLQASAVHLLLASCSSFTTDSPERSILPPDLDPSTQAALSSLALAEATLLAVLKDDSYVTVCIQARNPNDKDWMVRAPEIPKVRAHLFARLCIRAAEYAEQAAAGLGSVGAEGGKMGGIDDDLLKYTRVLGPVARARACRFFGVDAELAGKIGEGIAWLRAANGALGLQRSSSSTVEKESSTHGLSRLKQGWMERREAKRMEKDAGGRERGGDKDELGPGDKAGREEEGRVIEMLETKWVRMNDTINTQLIPPSADLVTSLPSGRDIHSPPLPYKLPSLDEDHLMRMRAPAADLEFSPSGDVDDSDVESPDGVREIPRANPERTGSAYY